MLNRALKLDRWLLVLIALSAMAGIVVILAASGQGRGLLPTRLKQLGLGVLLMTVISLVDFRYLRKCWPLALGVSLLTLVYALATVAVRGTRGWIPCFGATLQAVDVARVGLVFFMAHTLAVNREKRSFRGRFGWALGALGAGCLLVCLQPDYGSALALGLTGAVLLFIADLPKRWFLAGALALAILVGCGYAGSERIRQRIDLTVNFDPAASSSDNYQLKQSLIGIGAGGITGQGAGKGRQKTFLPDHHTDFIFSIVGEEFGLIGTVILLALLSGLALRVLRIGSRQVDPFARYLAGGIGGMLFIYTLLNIAVTLGLFPLTGVPLPFISHGGSALVMNLAALGLVLSVSRDRRRSGGDGERGRRRGVIYENLFRPGV